MTANMACNTKSGTTIVEDKMNEYFTANEIFFRNGDQNGKRIFHARNVHP
jgi:hypothetical protein